MLTLYPKNTSVATVDKNSTEKSNLSLWTLSIWSLIILFMMLDIDIRMTRDILMEFDMISIPQRILLAGMNFYLQCVQAIEDMSGLSLIIFIVIECIAVKNMFDLWIFYFKNTKIKNEWVKKTILKGLQPYIKIWRWFTKRL